jgi:hypothetical protein
MSVEEQARAANLPFWMQSQRAAEEKEIDVMDEDGGADDQGVDDDSEDGDGDSEGGEGDSGDDDTTDAGGEHTDCYRWRGDDGVNDRPVGKPQEKGLINIAASFFLSKKPRFYRSSRKKPILLKVMLASFATALDNL